MKATKLLAMLAVVTCLFSTPVLADTSRVQDDAAFAEAKARKGDVREREVDEKAVACALVCREPKVLDARRCRCVNEDTDIPKEK